MSDCPLDSSYQDAASYFACLRKSVGPAISSINPADPAYMHVHTTGPNVWVWIIVGVCALLFTFIGSSIVLTAMFGKTRPAVPVNPMRPRTGPNAAVVTSDGTVWARTRPASLKGDM